MYATTEKIKMRKKIIIILNNLIKFSVGMILILIGLNSCGVSKNNKNTEIITLQNPLEKRLPSELITGKIIKIDSTNSVYEIIVEDNQTHKILSKKTTEKFSNLKLLKVGFEYQFRVIPLTHLSIRNGTYNKEINGVKIMPSFRIIDCIKFNSEEFCSDVGEVYEGINLNGIYINE